MMGLHRVGHSPPEPGGAAKFSLPPHSLGGNILRQTSPPGLDRLGGHAPPQWGGSPRIYPPQWGGSTPKITAPPLWGEIFMPCPPTLWGGRQKLPPQTNLVWGGIFRKLPPQTFAVWGGILVTAPPLWGGMSNPGVGNLHQAAATLTLQHGIFGRMKWV